MRDILLFCIVLGSLPFILMRPQVGIIMWSWLGYMNPHRLTFGFAYAFPFSQIVAIVTFISLFLTREKKRFPWTLQTTAWIAFIVWMTVATIFALNPDGVWVDWEKYIKIQLFAVLTVMVMATRERMNALIWTIVGSIAFWGVKGGLFSMLTGSAYRIWGPSYSFIEDNNTLALALVMIVPLAWYLYATAAKRYMRWILVIVMLLISLSILTSYSRGALLALSAMAFSLWFRSRSKVRVGLAFLVIASVLLVAMPRQWYSRMETIETYQEDPSAMNRIRTWTFAVNLALDNPLTGGGFRAFSRQLFYKYSDEPTKLKDSHSIYFGVLAELGFVGLLFFLAMLFLTFRSAGWIIRNTEDHQELRWARILASMTQVSLIGYAVGGSFLGLAYFDLPYHLIGIVIILKMVVSEALTVQQSVSTEITAGDQGANFGTHPHVVPS
jgi:putative inorganic carbon (hco3(-)) transporter